MTEASCAAAYLSNACDELGMMVWEEIPGSNHSQLSLASIKWSACCTAHCIENTVAFNITDGAVIV
jgi:hypothetical protein